MDKPKAKIELGKNLRQASKEILTWRKTGLLPDGIIRSVAKAYLDDDLAVTEMFVENLALQKAAEEPTN